MALTKYITKIKTSQNFDDALDILCEAIKASGFDYYCFSNMSTHNSPAIFKLNDLRTNYPNEWVETYTENQYVFHDPVAIQLMANKAPFYWSDYLSLSEKIQTEESSLMMQDAQKHGLVDGMGMSYLHNQGNLHTLSISKKSVIENYDLNILSQFYLLGSSLVERYEALKETNNNKKIEVSDQEKTILTWGAVGKTDNDIAQLMDISVNTVRYHWKNIFEKLESYSRVFAIIQAMNLGFIDTQVFEFPTESGSSETHHRRV